MIRRVKWSVLTLLLAATSAAADSGPRPFKGHVEATWDNIFMGVVAPPATFVGCGPVTHMGRTTQSGTLTLVPVDNSGIIPGYGTVTITAADGSTVTFDYVGLLNAGTGEGVGEFVFTGGTGRFADVQGSGTFYAMIDLSVPTGQPMVVFLDGLIQY